MQIVAHEMRTPLSIVTNFIQMLKMIFNQNKENGKDGGSQYARDQKQKDDFITDIFDEFIDEDDIMNNIEL